MTKKDATHTPSGGEAVAWRWRHKATTTWNFSGVPVEMEGASSSKYEVEPLYASVPSPGVEILEKLHSVLRWLNGEISDEEGLSFGDAHPEHRGAFWWRRKLRPFLQATSPIALSAKAQAGAGEREPRAGDPPYLDGVVEAPQAGTALMKLAMALWDAENTSRFSEVVGEDRDNTLRRAQSILDWLHTFGWDVSPQAGKTVAGEAEYPDRLWLAFGNKSAAELSHIRFWTTDKESAEQFERSSGVRLTEYIASAPSPKQETVAGDVLVPREELERLERLIYTKECGTAWSAVKSLLASAPASSQPQTEWRDDPAALARATAAFRKAIEEDTTGVFVRCVMGVTPEDIARKIVRAYYSEGSAT